jgi:hypothetical protein
LILIDFVDCEIWLVSHFTVATDSGVVAETDLWLKQRKTGRALPLLVRYVARLQLDALTPPSGLPVCGAA